MPVHDTPARILGEAIESVRRQTAVDWELVVVDDGSSRAETVAALDLLDAVDARVRLVRRSSSGGISTASNEGIACAAGELIAFMDHDDVIFDGALAAMSEVFDDPAVDAAYSDEVCVTDDGVLAAELRKPDWSPTYLLACNYINHFSVFSRATLQRAGELRSALDGAQDHDLWLRVAELDPTVVHVPTVLYGWRMTATSVAGSASGVAKPAAMQRGVRAIDDALVRRGVAAHATSTAMGIYRIDATDRQEAVDLVVIASPTRREPTRIVDAVGLDVASVVVAAPADAVSAGVSPWVAWLDADVVPDPTWFDRAVLTLRAGGGDVIGAPLCAAGGAALFDQFVRTDDAGWCGVSLSGLPGHVLVAREVSGCWGGLVVGRREALATIQLGTTVAAAPGRRVVVDPSAPAAWSAHVAPEWVDQRHGAVTLADPYCPSSRMLAGSIPSAQEPRGSYAPIAAAARS